MNYLRTRKKRLREIEFSKIEEIQEVMKINDCDMAELLGLFVQVDPRGSRRGSSQFYNYRKCGRLPADRYYGARDALLLACEDELRKRREQIMRLFS